MADDKKLTTRKADFSAWYNEVVLRSELADYSPVRGCMVIRPNGYGIWERMQRTLDEAEVEARKMLGVYRAFMEGYIAMPVITGQKTDAERFAGALRTYCVEAMMQDNKALQAGTSHNLGQNFAKAFDLKFQTEAGGTDYAWNTSWGVTTRMVGGLVMTHGDDNGIVVPPPFGPLQLGG